MQLRKVKPDEQHLRSALLKDLQSHVKGIKKKALGGAIEKMRAGYAKGGTVSEGDKPADTSKPGDSVPSSDGPNDTDVTEKLTVGLDPAGDSDVESGDEEAFKEAGDDHGDGGTEDPEEDDSDDGGSIDDLIRALGRKSR